MWRRLLAVVAAIVFALLVPAGAASAEAGRPFVTTLTGAAEVPPADPDASGSASIVLNQGLGTVCFDLSWENIDGTVFAAHIHVGEVGVNGPIVVPLFAGTFGGTDSVSGCVEDIDHDLIKDIRQDPSSYYVNVHSTTFPGGAIRGQLSK
jgi:hypothetical protein